jgi:hypothetical protein
VLRRPVEITAETTHPEHLDLQSDFRHRKRGVETKLILADATRPRDDTLFKNIALGSDKALVVHAREGREPLCKFLGADVPSEPYPRTNARADFFSSVKSGTTATAD